MDVAQNALAQSTHNIAANKTANAVGNIQNTSKADKAAAAAKEFEAVYISQMLTHMFEGIETGGMFGGGNAENIYRSMMVDEYGKMIAQTGGIGLSGAVQASIIDMQSRQSQTGSAQ